MPTSHLRAQVNASGGPLDITWQETTTPARGWVRVDVAASGLCRADLDTVAAAGTSTRFPAVPGHEIAGTVAELGDDVTGWRVGERVAVGWFGGSCGQCDLCRTGDVVHCPQRKIPGLSYPGGWSQSVTVPVDALARVPDGLDLVDAAPMGCAGVTVFNAIRHAGLRAGARVAVFGVGGLGHLAIQFAAAMGYDTIAIARGAGRADVARKLGARHYIDSTTHPPGRALADLGGVDLILSTAADTAPVAELLTGLRVRGRLTLVGVDAASVDVPAARLVMNAQILAGHLTGSAHDTEEAMQFAVINQIRPMVQRMPLDRADEAVDQLSKGEARFRIVLDTSLPGSAKAFC